MNPNTSLTKIGYNSLQWLLRYGVYKVFGTHRLNRALTHGRTDPNTECLPHRFSTVVDGCIKYEMKSSMQVSQ